MQEGSDINKENKRKKGRRRKEDRRGVFKEI
jgi:hypothetical protein